MKYLIVSDSHGQRKELAAVIKRHQAEVDAVIHCGDSELEINADELEKVITVKGNCDYASFPEEVSVEFAGVPFYITHGHLYDVKMSYVPLSYRADELGAKIVCFGHSHIAASFQENGTVYINPGSLRLPRQPKAATYVIVSVSEETIDVQFYTIDGIQDQKLSNSFNR